MTQFIQSTPGSLAASMGYQTQAPQSNYRTGQLGLANGGLASLPRSHYGIGSWLKKKGKQAKNIVTKLTPKELAPAMTWAAPFLGPVAGPLMGGLGSLKMHGKLDPMIMAGAIAPHLQFGKFGTGVGGSGVGYGKWGQGAGTNDMNSLRRLLTGKGQGSAGGILNTGKLDLGTKLDQTLFGSKDKFSKGMKIPGEKGFLMDLQGETMEPGSFFNEIITKMSTNPKTGKQSNMILAGQVANIVKMSKTYAEALDMAKKTGMDGGMIPRPGSDEEWARWQEDISGRTKDWKEGTQMFAAHGGRAGYAMGSPQFPPQRRTGLQWGSDKGEGLGGEEVEADMRYEGGFMPYGEEPKADDVPARLSKDEFVFTDQAVAGAGEGDVELGAERLYNVMKNLEAGGRLSEESEGNMGEGIGAII